MIRKLIDFIFMGFPSDLIKKYCQRSQENRNRWSKFYDSIYFMIKRYTDRYELKLIYDLLSEGDTVVEVGANLGFYTVRLSDIVGKDGKVITFEPSQVTFDKLENRIKKMNCKNVVLEKMAITDGTKEVRLYLSDIHSGDNVIFEIEEERHFEVVKAISLDDYFECDMDKINFVKIDVEGAEGYVFEGMKNIIRSNKHLKIVTEFWPKRIKESGFDPLNFVNYLMDNGYSIFNIDKKCENNGPLTREEIKSMVNANDNNYYNFLCNSAMSVK